MGVSCVVVWDSPEGHSPAQALDELLKRLEVLSAQLLGPWTVDCETLQSAPTLASAAPQKLVHVLHSSDHPRTTFAVLEPSMTCLVADSALDGILAQLKAFYAPRKGLRIEIKGQSFEVKQFVVKCGSVAIGSTSKGVVVEVEDRGSERVGVAWPGLTEFTRGLLGSARSIEPPNVRPSDRPYTPSDTMVYFTYLFSQLRKNR